MAPPAVLPLPIIMGLEGADRILHGSVRRRPFFHIGEVGGNIAILHITTEADRAPEGLDVPEHLASERPDACHPVAVPAPEKVVARESVILVPGEIDPLGGPVGGEFSKPGNRWIDQDFGQSHLHEHQNGRRLDHQAELIAERTEDPGLGIGEGPSLLAADSPVHEAEEMQEQEFGDNRSQKSGPTVKPHTHYPRNPREKADEEIQPRCLCDRFGHGEGDAGQDPGNNQCEKNQAKGHSEVMHPMVLSQGSVINKQRMHTN